MKIREEIVIMLNEKSWYDVKWNYPESSSMETLKQFFVAFKKVCSSMINPKLFDW